MLSSLGEFKILRNAVSKTPSSYRVIVVEDDPVVRARLVRVLNASTGLNVSGAFENVRSTIRWLGQHAVDIVLVDLDLPDGHGSDVIRCAREKQIESMVISVFADEHNVTAAIRAGATGYLLKDSEDDRIVESVFQVLNGQSPISPGIARHLLRYFTERETDANSECTESELTARELEVLQFISRGFSYAEVADRLDMSINTLRTHVRHLYRKLEANSRTEAVYKASSQGLISI